ncbi:MAG TPA: hypothetical protein DCQ06_11205, partial [Myxococcales bacterium]|nr:hypothetical protein [Myxococcales bacterium]
MARRSRGFRLPALEPLPSSLVASSDEVAWSRGQACEDEFDFESARDWYRLAVGLSSRGSAAAALTRYCQFLVERYGQFSEVAAWLDDDSFEPQSAPESALARLVAQAAVEVVHPRAEALDLRLAHDHSDVDALGRVAKRWLDQGRAADALELLSAKRRGLSQGSRAREILSHLEIEKQRSADNELLGFRQALINEDLQAADHELQRLQDSIGHMAIYRAAASELRAMRHQQRVKHSRAASHEAYAAGRLSDALSLAEQWLKLEPDNLQAHEYTEKLQRDLDEAQRVALLSRLDEADPLGLRKDLIELWQRWGTATTVPSAIDPLWSWVSTLLEHAPAEFGSQEAIEHVLAIETLNESLSSADVHAIKTAVDAIHPAWRDTPSVLEATRVLSVLQRRVQREQDVEVAASVRSAILTEA